MVVKILCKGNEVFFSWKKELTLKKIASHLSTCFCFNCFSKDDDIERKILIPFEHTQKSTIKYKFKGNLKGTKIWGIKDREVNRSLIKFRLNYRKNSYVRSPIKGDFCFFSCKKVVRPTQSMLTTTKFSGQQSYEKKFRRKKVIDWSWRWASFVILCYIRKKTCLYQYWIRLAKMSLNLKLIVRKMHSFLLFWSKGRTLLQSPGMEVIHHHLMSGILETINETIYGILESIPTVNEHWSFWIDGTLTLVQKTKKTTREIFGVLDFLH